MVQRDLGGVTTDVCESSCGGLWLDCGEIRDLDEPHEGFGEALRRVLEQGAPRSRKGRLRCPACSTPMREHRYRGIARVLIDECYACGGFFLDPGELRSIRDALGERVAREQKVTKLTEDDPLWQRCQAEIENERDLTGSALRFNRFLMQRVFPFKWPP